MLCVWYMQHMNLFIRFFLSLSLSLPPPPCSLSVSVPYPCPTEVGGSCGIQVELCSVAQIIFLFVSIPKQPSFGKINRIEDSWLLLVLLLDYAGLIYKVRQNVSKGSKACIYSNLGTWQLRKWDQICTLCHLTAEESNYRVIVRGRLSIHFQVVLAQV